MRKETPKLTNTVPYARSVSKIDKNILSTSDTEENLHRETGSRKSEEVTTP